jgi:hypothetical protein
MIIILAFQFFSAVRAITEMLFDNLINKQLVLLTIGFREKAQRELTNLICLV